MTTEDIRVIRPACEKLFGEGIYDTKHLAVALTNYCISNKDVDLPFCKYDMERFIKTFSQSKEGKCLISKLIDKKKLSHATPDNILGWWGDYFNHSYNSPVLFAQEVVRNYILTPEKERSVYIFEGKFFDQFSNINIKNLRGSHLPQEGTGCIVLPRPIRLSNNPHLGGSDSIDEVIFHVGYTSFLNRGFDKYIARLKEWGNDVDKRKTLMASMHEHELLEACQGKMLHPPGELRLFVLGINNKNHVYEAYAEFPLRDDALVQNAIENSYYAAPGQLGDPDSTDKRCLTLVINLLAYLNSGKPDIREFQNTIRYRGKSTVNVRPEDEELSRGKVFLVGFNWLKNPIYTVDGWWSSGYMAWKMCGPGRSEPRLVTFKGSFKQRRKGREDIITEENATEGEDYTEC